MDIERTMQFIIDNLATVTAAQQQAEVRAARTDRQIHGLQTLVKIGMRRLVKLEQGQVSLRKALNELAVSQKRTDEVVQGLAASQKRTDGVVRELAAFQKRTDEVVRELAASQKRTDEKFERWLDSLKGRNGRRNK